MTEPVLKCWKAGRKPR